MEAVAVAQRVALAQTGGRDQVAGRRRGGVHFLATRLGPEQHPGRVAQRQVEEAGDDVAAVRRGADERNGLHRPIETEHRRLDQQPKVDERQVQERQRPRQPRGTVGRRIVGRSEFRRLGSHQVEPDGDQNDGAGRQRQKSLAQSSVFALKRKKKKNDEPVAAQKQKTNGHGTLS